ncbi:MAG: Ldh family oxidoreductase [Proteobacteria bacterium]|jgi:LDH2 family malate/lactate/ureidoglycolate dehydrogenase|nr:Ldh family oxidoreductase [Pseudomonadota bacterium]
MSAATTRVAAEALRGLVARLFVAAGLPAGTAQAVADGLVDAELEGTSSHGVMLVDLYLGRIREGSVSTHAAGTIVSDRGAAVVLDAGHALGQPTADQAMALAVERAKRLGAGVVAVRHGFHFGAARRYALQAALADCVGIVACNTRPLMPAPGGAARVVGNNPLAIAVPSDGAIPIVLDMATSEAAMGRIRMAAKAGRAIPAGWAVAADGTPTTEPAAAIAGMLLPAAGPKGFGLAFVLDLMCGLLSGGASGDAVRPLYGDHEAPYDCSHLFIAIDVAHFADPRQFKAAAAAAAERVRHGARAPGVARLYAPGEIEWQRRSDAQGEVQLEASVVAMLTAAARALGVSALPLTHDNEAGHAP